MPVLMRDLHAHGYSLRENGMAEDCKKCTFHCVGQHLRANNHNHSEACRARIYDCLRRAEDPRIVAADAEGEERQELGS